MVSPRLVNSIAAALLFSQCSAQDERPVGAVLEIKGDWKIDNAPVKIKQSVYPGKIIELAGDTATAFLKILYYHGLPHTCNPRDPIPCRSVTIRKLTDEAGPAQDRWMSLLASIFDNAPRLVAAMSRADATSDRIARWTPKGIEFVAPVTTTGAVRWQVAKLDANGNPVAQRRQIFDFGGGAALKANLAPGLYRVDLMSIQHAPLGSSFWLLVLRDPSKATASIRNLEELTASWPPDDHTTKQQLMRGVFLANRPKDKD